MDRLVLRSVTDNFGLNQARNLHTVDGVFGVRHEDVYLVKREAELVGERLRPL